MRIKAALQGDLRRIMAEELQVATQGVQLGIKQTGEALKKDLRNETENALGNNVSGQALGKHIYTTWHLNYYPNKGLNAAALVYSDIPHIIAAHSESQVITAKHGRFLAVPTELVPRGRRNKRIMPSNWPASWGKLRFIPSKRGGGLLVVEGRTTAKGRFTGKITKSGKTTTTAIMYILVPQVRTRKRLHMNRHIKKAETALVNNIIRNYR